MDKKKREIIWAEISLKAIKKNIVAIKKLLKPKTKIMAVVKANAYGHGTFEIAKEALKNGVTNLGVARIDEALHLRKKGIKAPILIFSYTDETYFKELINHKITQTVFSFEYAKKLSDFAKTHKKKMPIHIKVDTGMGRCGMLAEPFRTPQKKMTVLEEIKKIADLQNIFLEGIYTHFACADEKNKNSANLQFKIFASLLKSIEKEKIKISIKHAANSAGAIEMPETHLDMIRLGIALYGLYPSSDIDKKKIKLTPAMSLKTRIILIKKVPKNFKVSYGSTFKTNKKSTLAILPLGYADGFNRLFSSKGSVLIKGKKAPVVGRVCMDHTVIDVTHIPYVKVNDEVVIFGCQKKETISADNLAKNLNTINYEIVSTIMERVKRIY